MFNALKNWLNGTNQVITPEEIEEMNQRFIDWTISELGTGWERFACARELIEQMKTSGAADILHEYELPRVKELLLTERLEELHNALACGPR